MFGRVLLAPDLQCSTPVVRLVAQTYPESPAICAPAILNVASQNARGRLGPSISNAGQSLRDGHRLGC